MKLPRYKDVLKMTKEKIDETLAPVRARQAKKQAELEVAKLDERILTMESEITKLCTENPIPFERLIDKQDAMKLAERRRKQFGTIIEQLFPDD